MSYSDNVLADSPLVYWRLGEASGTTMSDSSGNSRDGVYDGNIPTLGVDGAVSGDTAAQFDGADTASYADTSSILDFAHTDPWSVEFWIKRAAAVTTARRLIARDNCNFTTYAGWYVDLNSSNQLRFRLINNNASNKIDINTTSSVADGEWHHVVITYDGSASASGVTFYVDNAVAATSTAHDTLSATTATGSRTVRIGRDNCATGSGTVVLDEIAFYGAELTASQVDSHFPAAASTSIPLSLSGGSQGVTLRLVGGAYQASQSVPLDLDGTQTSAQLIALSLSALRSFGAQSIPMSLRAYSGQAAQSVPLRLESADATHFAAAHASWSVAVSLGGSDISSKISGEVRIEHEEDASGVCLLSFVPPAGSIDPDSYENQPLAVSFVGLDASGSETYSVRRFTGLVERASWSPLDGRITINATTDLQGRFESMGRDVIDALIGGYWSPHVFDDTADGWQYAQDRLSTRAAEMHVDRYGRLVVVDLAAKSTADIAIADAQRFNDTLQVRRASKRDLITQYTATMDFRYTRLRHREVSVRWFGAAFCDWANTGWPALTRNMVTQAADGTNWTRISDITFDAYPPAGLYCSPLRGWAGDPDDELCLGATWTAARRWAQTVTEVYSLTVTASDMVEALGVIPLSEDYGIEATYDAKDYESRTDFAGPPTGSAYDSALGDYALEGTDAEYDGRSAMETAQQCVIAKGRSEILKRARRTIVSFSPNYRPDIDLTQTVQVTATGLVAKGKVRRIAESLNTSTGRIDQTVELAISRHGGSGLAVDSEIAAADQPATSTEEQTSRYVALSTYVGGLASSVAESDTWSGYIVNADPNIRVTGAPLYDRRFTVRMPEIEQAARQATELAASQSYTVAVPNDTLTFEA